jgi:hypothetical protein
MNKYRITYRFTACKERHPNNKDVQDNISRTTKAFQSYGLNIIVGKDENGNKSACLRKSGNGRQSDPVLRLSINAVSKMSKGLGATVRIPYII